MLKLSDREWKEFKITKIFGDSINSKAYHYNNLKEENSDLKNSIPYITRTNLNNGLFCVVNKEDDFIINPKNTISFGAENATYFYQPYEYITGNKMYYYKNSNLSKYSLLFILNCLNKSILDCGFGYGFGLTGKRSDSRKILLPTTPQGEPDYQFMEDYIKELIINKKRQKYIEYVKKKIKNLESIGEEGYKKLSDREWKEFKIGELFFINSGINISEINRKIGDIPYVSSTSMNNGISCFIDNKNNSFDKNVISVNSNGSVGYCFYHKYNSLFSNDCKKLKIKKEIYCNEYVYLFLSNQIMEQKNKYSYGYKMGSERLKKQIILLPTTPQGEPDYQFMEDYIKKLILKKYNNYLNCLSKIINN